MYPMCSRRWAESLWCVSRQQKGWKSGKLFSTSPGFGAGVSGRVQLMNSPPSLPVTVKSWEGLTRTACSKLPRPPWRSYRSETCYENARIECGASRAAGQAEVSHRRLVDLCCHPARRLMPWSTFTLHHSSQRMYPLPGVVLALTQRESW